MNGKNALDVFEKAPVPQAVLKNALPAIPALFILQAAFGVTGLAWAQPVADLLSTVLVGLLYLWASRKGG